MRLLPWERDEASLYVIEAMLVGMIMVGAVAFLALTPLPGQDPDLAESEGELLAADALTLLEERPGRAPYKSLLHELVTNATRGDVSDLADWLNRTLPPGAEWGFYLDNGEELETFYETAAPDGVVHTRDVLVSPNWNYAHVFATMDRQHGTTALTNVRFEVVPVRNSYLDREASGSLVFGNGVSVPLVAGADGVLVADDVPPEYVAAPNGYDVPYDTTDLLNHSASVAAKALEPPVAYGVSTTLPYPVVQDTVYRVHPNYVVDATLQAFLESQPRVTTSSPKAKPGDSATITYDFAGLPLDVGWTVQSREIHVYGPVLGDEVEAASLPALSGTYEFLVPRDALYGTYVVEVRLGLVNADLVQTVHDVTAFDVLRRGVDAPVPPLYRAVVAVWYPGLS